MGKYNFEFKKKIVIAYLNGTDSYRYLAKKYGVASDKDISKCFFTYKEFGDEGLLRSRKREKYTFQFKIHVVEVSIN